MIISFLLMLSMVWTWTSGDAQGGSPADTSADPSTESKRIWRTLIAQADALGLATNFLKAISPGFVTVEFDDLHAFAAEYHPGEHRMVLNRTLSFNAAGGVLKSLTRLTPRDLGTLYHELFHAYMDYIVVTSLSGNTESTSTRLLAFARDRQECRYRQVSITPILQRKSHTEPRLLSDHESWEALNETWAVFVGWTVWTQLEERSAGSRKGGAPGSIQGERWLTRLKKADRDADLIGYYEPDDPAERSMARKRYLAPTSRITPQEVGILVEQVMEFPSELARRSVGIMEQNRASLPGSSPCQL